ncbi:MULTISPECIES: exonuclease SbcCD subunit D [Gracilibacillus]|uniref:Nuclease SbcCD subunit D n=1 Tax=Gracilibacillus dipsosauri TaxID=178340 RepID=A0A317KYR5_9BACI|nr:exonuclease SbcCD subunit D [Gracilibacillus dipsosauri]PWU68692.1 exonuclease subunit SbcD [Gracilibacillus dipsosauri]
MKIIHTADWHLGKLVHGIHATADQAYVLEQLTSLIKEEKPDVLIIAGDLYDRSIPPKEAVELLNHVISDLCMNFKIPILAIAGNHDSPDRLGFGTSIFRSQQFYLHTTVEEALQPVPIEDNYGMIYFHLIPYLEPSQISAYFKDDTIETHHQAMEKIIQEIKMRTPLHEGRHILVGHAFVAGGMETDSEERLTMIGGTPYVGADLFDEIDYVALGHLHRPQKIKRETIRYSGSILKYSFSEADHTKSVTMVEMDETGACEIEQRALTPMKDMRIIKGYFDDLIQEKIIPRTEDYLQIQLLDDGQIMDPVSKLRKLFPNILRLERKQYMVNTVLKDKENIRQKQEMSHEQLFHAFYQEMKGEKIPETRAQYFNKVMQSIVTEERGK